MNNRIKISAKIMKNTRLPWLLLGVGKKKVSQKNLKTSQIAIQAAVRVIKASQKVKKNIEVAVQVAKLSK